MQGSSTDMSLAFLILSTAGHKDASYRCEVRGWTRATKPASNFWPGVLSGASAKFRPLLVTVQCRTACGADVAVFSPTHRDAYGHSSRLSPFAPLQQSLARFRSAAL